jgi:hypothetical protein
LLSEEARSKPYLRIDHTIRRMVDPGFVGDSLYRLCRLHDSHRVLEGLQIALQRGRLSLIEPPREIGGIVGWQAGIPLLPSKVQDCFRAETTVKMVVKRDFGK